MTISGSASQFVDPYDERGRAYADGLMKDVLAEIGRVMSSSLYIEEIYSYFVEQARRILQFDRITIMAVDRENWVARYAYTSGVEVPGCAVGCEVSISGTFREEILISKTGRMLTEQQIIESARQYPMGIAAVTFQQGIREILSVPLSWHNEIIGFLTICSLNAGIYDQDDLRVLERIGETIAGPVANSQIHAELQRYANESSTLAEIGHIVNSSIHFGDAFSQLASRARLLIPFQHIMVSLRSHGSGEITCTNALGVDVPRWTPGTTVPIGAAERAALLRRSAVIRSAGITYLNDGPQPYKDAGASVGLAGVLVAPIVLRDEVLGFLSFRSERSDAYTPGHEVSAMRIAGLIAGPIANARLRAELRLEVQARSLTEQMSAAALGAGSVELFSCRCAETLSSFVPVEGVLAALAACEERGLWNVYGAVRDPAAPLTFSYVHAALRPPAAPSTTDSALIQTVGGEAEVPQWIKQFNKKPKSWMHHSSFHISSPGSE